MKSLKMFLAAVVMFVIAFVMVVVFDKPVIPAVTLFSILGLVCLGLSVLHFIEEAKEEILSAIEKEKQEILNKFNEFYLVPKFPQDFLNTLEEGLKKK
ncbi:MAG: hypothetical protein Q8O98_00100 [bacterium]|nr:hypothetical protein [bacterium]